MVGMAWDRVRGARHWPFPLDSKSTREKERKKKKKKRRERREERKAGEKERETGEREKKRREITAVLGRGARRGMLIGLDIFCIKKCFQFYQLKLSQGL